MSMKLILIPLAVFLFVVIYPNAEYAIDCPNEYDPIGNENCTFVKHMLWIVVANLSLTEFGFPSQCEVGMCWWEQENNPDAYDSHNMIPMGLVVCVVLVIIKSREYEENKRMNRMRSLR